MCISRNISFVCWRNGFYFSRPLKAREEDMKGKRVLQSGLCLFLFSLISTNSFMRTAIDGMELIYIPAGEAWVGSGEWDHEYKLDETPEHKVSLDAFWMYKTEVSNAMYAQCVNAGVCDEPCSEETNPRFRDPLYANHPVVYVTWQNAMDYCTWVGGRLPTEAEWEKAARGSGKAKYPWQDDDPSAKNVNAANSIGDTTPVGSYPLGASEYGVLDMAGNVREWVYDWYREDYYPSAPTQNPMGAATGTDKVLKGGSYYDNYEHTRIAGRLHHSPSSAGVNRGFRCVILPKK